MPAGFRVRNVKLRPRQRRRCGVVAVAGGCLDFDGVPWARPTLGFPAWGFFAVVAGFAQPGCVSEAGGSAVAPGDDVVQMADGCVAVWCAAGVVACLDEAAESRREEP